MELSFGEKLRNMREDMDITQSDLGKEVHMTQRKISYIENNISEPSVDDIKALCLYFKVSADYLLGLPKDLKYPER